MALLPADLLLTSLILRPRRLPGPQIHPLRSSNIFTPWVSVR